MKSLRNLKVIRKIRKIKMKDTKIDPQKLKQNNQLLREISNESYWLNLKIVFFFHLFKETNKVKLIFLCPHNRRNNQFLTAILSSIRLKKSHLCIFILLFRIFKLNNECPADHNKKIKILIFLIHLRIKKLTNLHNQILIQLS